MRPSPVLTVLLGLVAAACSGGEASPATPAETVTVTSSASPTGAGSTDPATPSSSDTDTVTPLDQGEGNIGDAVVEDDELNDRTRAALDEAMALWAGQTGELYVWSYREEGEGLVDDYCVEGVAGEGASDAAACPFEATPGGQAVEDWLETIAIVLDAAPETGRLVDATFDATAGYPTMIDIFGGETDGFRFSLLDFRFEEPLGETEHPDFAACDGGDPDACYRYGLDGEPAPPSFDRSNAYSQTPDDAIVRDCRAGDPQACYEAGFRGFDDPRQTDE